MFEIHYLTAVPDVAYLLSLLMRSMVNLDGKLRKQNQNKMKFRKRVLAKEIVE